MFQRCREEWGELLDDLDVQIVTFEDLELEPDARDSEIWHACQRNGIVLLTANRNAESEDSLEATISDHNQSDSLPVLTINHWQRRFAAHGYGILQSDRGTIDGNAH